MGTHKSVRLCDSYSIIVVVSLLFTWLLFGTNSLGSFSIITLILPIILYPQKNKFYLGKMSRTYLIFIFYGSIITILNFDTNYNKQTSFNQMFRCFIILGICMLLVSKLDIDTFFRKLRNVGCFLSVIGCIEGIVKIPFLAQLLSDEVAVSSREYRIILIFHSPIICGFFLCMFLCILIMYPLKNSKANLFFGITNVIAILFNRSRSSWIAVTFVLIIYILKKHDFKIIKTFLTVFHLTRKKLNIILLFIGLFAISQAIGKNFITSLITLVSNRFKGTLEAGEGNIVRIETVLNAKRYWEKGHLFQFIWGGGKNFDKIVLEEYPVIKGNGAFIWNGCVDNQYITWILEFGIIGFLIIMSLICIVVKRIIYCEKNDQKNILTNTLILLFMLCSFFFESFNYALLMTMMTLFFVLSDWAWKRKG